MRDVSYPVIDMKATGKRIRQLRIEKGIKIEEIARFMGFSMPRPYTSGSGETAFLL